MHEKKTTPGEVLNTGMTINGVCKKCSETKFVVSQSSKVRLNEIFHCKQNLFSPESLTFFNCSYKIYYQYSENEKPRKLETHVSEKHKHETIFDKKTFQYLIVELMIN